MQPPINRYTLAFWSGLVLANLSDIVWMQIAWMIYAFVMLWLDIKTLDK